MKISLEWLNEYVELSNLDPQMIALELTMKTAEVDSIQPASYFLDKVIVGEILSVNPIKGYKRLSLVEVNTGSEKLFSICSAPNIRAGLKVPFASPGAALANNPCVEKIILAGLESTGVLCSAKELGLGEYHETILEVPAEVPAGKKFKDLLPSHDYLIEIDNKSITNRPDLWGHYGIARELAAIFNRELKPLKQLDWKDFDSLPVFPITIDDFSLCPGYCCLLIEGIHHTPAPLFVQRRLHAVEVRSINILVDLTNYIMYELGQPIHAFDADYLKSIRVAPLGIDSEFITLDNQIRKILSEDLIIWNEKEPIALAGIMGGLLSGISANTSRLVLESANFHPARIRRTSIRLGLRTDASQRFEKDLPRALMPLAITRYLQLAIQAGQTPQIKSSFSYKGDLGLTPRSLCIPDNYISRFLGQKLSYQETIRILSAIDFNCRRDNDKLIVEIPLHRSQHDIGIQQDIVEEVARFYGYNNINPQLPAVTIAKYNFNELLQAKHKIQRFLAQSRGFIEVHAYSWYDDRWLAKINWEPNNSLILANPIAPYKSRLRQKLIPNLLKMISQNYAYYNELKLFEVGQVYTLAKKGSYETTHLGIVVYQNGKQTILESLFLKIKGLLEDIVELLGCGPLEFKIGLTNSLSWAQSNAHLEIWKNKRHCGELGYLTNSILKAFKNNTQIAWLELELNNLSLLNYHRIYVSSPSIFPASWLDFSILWPTTKSYISLESILNDFKDDLVLSRCFITAYSGQQLDSSLKSYTFRYWISFNNRTLTKEDINNFKTRFLDFLMSKELQLRKVA